MIQQVDVTVVGAGPIGLYASYMCGMYGLSVALIDADTSVGGLCQSYSHKYIYDIAGYPRVKSSELVKNLLQQVNQYSPTIYLNTSVSNLSPVTHGWLIDNTVQSKAVILATGCWVWYLQAY